MPQTVAILGGGVAGLSAAHELAERGFSVDIYERKPVFGGKARSIPVAGSGVDGRADLPGEHGFRFFPGFYRHVTDTMRRIPYGAHGSTYDNLAVATRMLLAAAGHAGGALRTGKEPNLNLFWMPQFDAKGGDAAASAYERLLAQTYDALKAVSPDLNVIGGAVSPRGQDKAKSARQTHSPSTFIPDLGAAYRKSRRAKPIMDMFAFHPYLI